RAVKHAPVEVDLHGSDPDPVVAYARRAIRLAGRVVTRQCIELGRDCRAVRERGVEDPGGVDPHRQLASAPQLSIELDRFNARPAVGDTGQATGVVTLE